MGFNREALWKPYAASSGVVGGIDIPLTMPDSICHLCFMCYEDNLNLYNNPFPEDQASPFAFSEINFSADIVPKWEINWMLKSANQFASTSQ